MKYRLTVSEEVTAQILSLVADYEGIREGLGAELENEMAVLLETISRSPLLYPKEIGEIHRGLVKRFKLNVYYLVRGDRIGVIEVRDARREPPDWQGKGYRLN